MMDATTGDQRYWWRRSRPIGHAETVNVGRGERIASGVLGGLLLALGIGRREWPFRLLGVIGGVLALRGATGHSLLYDRMGVSSAGLQEGAGINVDEEIVIEAPLRDVYRFWSDLTNLPKVMRHLRAVTTTGPGRTHWVLDTPAESPLEFDAEVIERREGEVVAWRTLPGSDIEHAGSMRFHKTPGGRGTVMRLKLRYVPGAGALGFAGAKLLSGTTGREIAEELERFKQLVEGALVASADGHPADARKRAASVAGAARDGETGEKRSGGGGGHERRPR